MSGARHRAVWISVVLSAGCGRIGFDIARGSEQQIDASPTDGAPPVCDGSRLVAHYKLDETTGAAIVDSAGGADGTWIDQNDGNVSGEAVAGKRGGALQFDTGRAVIVPGFVLPSEGTLAVWLMSTFDDTSMPASHPMVIDAPTPRTTISFAGNIASYGLRTNDVSWQATYAPPTDITGWFHLAAVWSGSGAQLYIDGVPRGTGMTTDARSTSPAGLFIGTREQLDRWWFGLIDDLRIYDAPLSPADIAALVTCP